ncbi:NUDIX hydrolase [Nocardioides rotundus]|uniref:NUDIX hydrolase n=1 Tax=Nocardioides rotundus TaxID=1774216 RepID=UPI001CC01BFE|nr:NUDIX hydrolase [Nocardioides rotundus]UAL29492.1 NUDIX hydrolase [Nocardioides rotundus]
MARRVDVPLPQRLVDQAREYAAGERTPAEPRDAATVVLLRESAPVHPESAPVRAESALIDADSRSRSADSGSRSADSAGSGVGSGSEVYLLRRQTSMAFAGGMCVFPGGGVDPRDFEETPAWAGPSPAEWATQLGCEEPLARALVCAAVRETFEESGVLLAGPSAEEVVADTTGEDWEDDRVALEGRTLSMTDFLTRRGLVLRTDLLGAFAAWTTPVFEPKRFATWFFAAVLPEGQRTRDVSSESDQVMWVPAEDAVARVDQGDVFMLPPTYLSCLEVARLGTPEEVLAAIDGRVLEMFTPEVEERDGGFRLSIPPGAEELLS